MSLIDDIGKENGKESLPRAHVGDTVQVHYLIKEGDKERVQIFTGTVIAVRGRGIARNVTVRRIVQGEGVERTFPLHSPRVKSIEVSRRGKVRQARLYYLRDRVGKQTRVDELVGEKARRDREQAHGASPADETDEASSDESLTDPAPEQTVEV
jgi:large subunit ribosomal protein L19